MSSSEAAALMSYYTRIINNLYNTFGYMLLGVGTIGCVLNCIMFTQKIMRKSSSSIYFLAFNIISLFILYSILFITLLRNSSKIDLTILSIIGCKIYYYIRTVVTVLASYYLVLASIDRALFTSPNALIRQRSTHRLAYQSIGGVTIIILLYYIQTPVFANLYQLYPGVYLCYYPQESYRNFSTFNSLIINAIVPILLLTIFGTLTVKHLYQKRIQPVTVNPTVVNTGRSNKTRQMTMMLLIEILIYAFCQLMLLCFNIYSQLTQNQTKTAQQTALEQFIISIFFLFTIIPHVTSFYVYLVISKPFRKQTCKVLFNICRYHLNHNG
ncbi:unnamed protein product [Adineta steineri]|uniref:G-protein coupled receptors family 1 profile domain-containing protein n=1 Tax=Adineta steineri TaxID=433720 RepID=A0A813U8G3_9BILA|nr:unnamed protein product [Adineta steineri]